MFFFSSRRRHTRCGRDWSSDVCSSDLTAEKNPKFAWELNMEGLFNVLDLAKDGHLKKIFWPSSIAVFGPTTPKTNTPQHTIMEPALFMEFLNKQVNSGVLTTMKNMELMFAVSVIQD